jgi:hypothetical protein
MVWWTKSFKGVFMNEINFSKNFVKVMETSNEADLKRVKESVFLHMLKLVPL